MPASKCAHFQRKAENIAQAILRKSDDYTKGIPTPKDLPHKRDQGQVTRADAEEAHWHLLSHDIIRKEDFLGIEHFIFGTLSTQSKIRKRHAAAVLRKQQKHQKQKLEDPDLNLAKFAETSSLRTQV